MGCFYSCNSLKVIQLSFSSGSKFCQTFGKSWGIQIYFRFLGHLLRNSDFWSLRTRGAKVGSWPCRQGGSWENAWPSVSCISQWWDSESSDTPLKFNNSPPQKHMSWFLKTIYIYITFPFRTWYITFQGPMLNLEGIYIYCSSCQWQINIKP